MPKLVSERSHRCIEIMCCPSPTASPYSTDDEADDGAATAAAPGNVDGINNDIDCHGPFNHQTIINQDHYIKFNPSSTSSPHASFGEAKSDNATTSPRDDDGIDNDIECHGPITHQKSSIKTMTSNLISHPLPPHMLILVKPMTAMPPQPPATMMAMNIVSFVMVKTIISCFPSRTPYH